MFLFARGCEYTLLTLNNTYNIRIVWLNDPGAQKLFHSWLESRLVSRSIFLFFNFNRSKENRHCYSSNQDHSQIIQKLHYELITNSKGKGNRKTEWRSADLTWKICVRDQDIVPVELTQKCLKRANCKK